MAYSDAGIANLNMNLVFVISRFNDDSDTAVFSELHRVADQVKQNLTQTGNIADRICRNSLVDIRDNFDSFCLGTRSHELDRFLDHGRECEWARFNIESAGFNF